MALYKVPNVKGHSKFAYSFLSLLIAATLSAIVFHASIYFDYMTLLYSVLWGSGFALVVMFQMELLKKLDTSAVFPITSLTSQVFVIILGLSFFHDKITGLQFVGLIVALCIVGFYNNVHKRGALHPGAVLIMTAIVLLSTSTKFIQKLGAIDVELNNFIFWQLFFAALTALVIWLVAERKDLRRGMSISRGVALWSVALGTLNFIVTFEIVKALSTGPFTLVYTILSFYLLITPVLAWWWFGEELTTRKILFLLGAIGATIIIGLG